MYTLASGQDSECHLLAVQVLIPTSQFIRSLVAARLAADVCGVPTVLIARTDAHSANLLTADVDERDRPFLAGQRTPEGFHTFNGGIKARAQPFLSPCLLYFAAVGCISLSGCGFLSDRYVKSPVAMQGFALFCGGIQVLF